MIQQFLAWFGRMTPAQRALDEAAEIDRMIYDAERAVHQATSTLEYLKRRREFLNRSYELMNVELSASSKTGSVLKSVV